jgi:hypothetical protein
MTWETATTRIGVLKDAEEAYDGEGRCSLLITFTATKFFGDPLATPPVPPKVTPAQETEWKQNGIEWEVWGSGTEPIWASDKYTRLKVVRDTIVAGRAEVPVRIIVEAICKSGETTGEPWGICDLYAKTSGPPTELDRTLLTRPRNTLTQAQADEVRKAALYLYFTIKIPKNVDGGDPIELPIDMCIHP